MAVTTQINIAKRATAAIQRRNDGFGRYADGVTVMARDLSAHARLVRSNAVDLDEMESTTRETIASAKQLLEQIRILREEQEQI